jgi:hypothetical protein
MRRRGGSKRQVVDIIADTIQFRHQRQQRRPSLEA